MTDTTLDAERRSSLQGILKPPPFCNDSTTASSARCSLMAAAPLSVSVDFTQLSPRPELAAPHMYTGSCSRVCPGSICSTYLIAAQDWRTPTYLGDKCESCSRLLHRQSST